MTTQHEILTAMDPNCIQILTSAHIHPGAGNDYASVRVNSLEQAGRGGVPDSICFSLDVDGGPQRTGRLHLDFSQTVTVPAQELIEVLRNHVARSAGVPEHSSYARFEDTHSQGSPAIAELEIKTAGQFCYLHLSVLHAGRSYSTRVDTLRYAFNEAIELLLKTQPQA